MPSEVISENIVVKIFTRNNYLHIVPATKSGEEALLRATRASTQDIDILFWGEDSVKRICDLFRLSERERKEVFQGKAFRRRGKKAILIEWIEQQKRRREHREKVLNDIELVNRALHKLFLKDKRLQKKANQKVKSDILHSMDGSTTLWLSVILSSRKDFLRLHGDPRRESEWDFLTSEDLLEENGSLKRGLDDAWQYITARDFLLRDDYYIDFGIQENGTQKSINLSQLLAWLVETCGGRALDSSIIDPSIEKLRAELARTSGDPKLIFIYCKPE